jgi:serine/threonine protein phosphatase PrpC
MAAERLTIAGRTNVFETDRLSKRGGRAINQDYCDSATADETVCWIVADGLGGHQGGEVASRAAVQAAIGSFRATPEISRDALERHIASAHAAVQEQQRANPAESDMRTTLSVLIADSRYAIWGHVGDTRLYRFGVRGVVTQTLDHSVPQALVNAGDLSPEGIRGHPDRSRLLRTVGESGPARPTLLPSPEPLTRGDAFLLCTDGYWEHVLELEMIADLAASASPREWLERGEGRLLRRATGEFDNYSAIAVICAAPDSPDVSTEPRVVPLTTMHPKTASARPWWRLVTLHRASRANARRYHD